MKYSIIACGESARNWQPEPDRHSIGVNDSWKWGKPTDSLLVANRPQTFNPERYQTIIHSKPQTFYSHKGDWSTHFPNWKRFPLVTWYGTLHWNQVYSSQTSPFIAVSLAYYLKATDIVLYGVDMQNHHVFNNENPECKREVGYFMDMIGQMNQQGCKVWLGAKGSAFDELLPMYKI